MIIVQNFVGYIVKHQILNLEKSMSQKILAKFSDSLCNRYGIVRLVYSKIKIKYS